MKLEKKHLITIIFSISLLNLIVYLITQIFFSYGIFRDELYYLACANRLDLGYVDHPPLSIYILASWKFLFGDSLLVIRFVPAIVASASLFILGLFIINLGGKKPAIIIALLSFMFTPIFLGINTIYSMNTFDYLFWILSAYLFLRIIQTEDKKYWLWLGFVLGLGLLNKTSVLWLGAGILVGTIFTSLKKDLKTRYPYIAFLIALLIFSPYVIWNVTHDFAHLEFMRNAATRKYGGLSPISFIKDQLLILNPLTILIWLAGFIFFFFKKNSKQFRPLGFIWLTTFLILIVNAHSKGEYIAPAYQILFAGGAVLIESWSTFPKRSFLKYAIIIPVLIGGIVLSPLARPLLSPESFIKYQSALGLAPPSNEGLELIELPQFYADMFGWEDLARHVSKVYQSLPVKERETTVVYCSNYGKAGAIEYYSKKYPLPKVISPHNSYWYWWPKDPTPTSIIIIGGEVEDHLESLKEVYVAVNHYSKYSIPYENNQKIYIGRGLKRKVVDIRLSNKIFI